VVFSQARVLLLSGWDRLPVSTQMVPLGVACLSSWRKVLVEGDVAGRGRKGDAWPSATRSRRRPRSSPARGVIQRPAWDRYRSGDQPGRAGRCVGSGPSSRPRSRWSPAVGRCSSSTTRVLLGELRGGAGRLDAASAAKAIPSQQDRRNWMGTANAGVRAALGQGVQGPPSRAALIVSRQLPAPSGQVPADERAQRDDGRPLRLG